MKKKKLWVVKVGSQLLIEQGPLFIRSLVRDLVEVRRQESCQVILVSSGAIATARQRLSRKWKTLAEKQALSALGQPMVMELYNLALHAHGLNGAQVLLSYSDFKMQTNRQNFVTTIRQLLAWNVVPVLNENDAVATEEIQFGDNDFLSAMIASELKADKLVLLTNVPGLYDRNPQDSKAQVVSSVSKVTSKVLAMASSSSSEFGRGGMASKLKAAAKAAASGVQTHIVMGSQPGILLNLSKESPPGTTILGSKKKKLGTK